MPLRFIQNNAFATAERCLWAPKQCLWDHRTSKFRVSGFGALLSRSRNCKVLGSRGSSVLFGAQVLGSTFEIQDSAFEIQNSALSFDNNAFDPIIGEASSKLCISTNIFRCIFLAYQAATPQSTCTRRPSQRQSWSTAQTTVHTMQPGTTLGRRKNKEATATQPKRGQGHKPKQKNVQTTTLQPTTMQEHRSEKHAAETPQWPSRARQG